MNQGFSRWAFDSDIPAPRAFMAAFNAWLATGDGASRKGAISEPLSPTLDLPSLQPEYHPESRPEINFP
jgi:hypothetical protein